MTTWPEVLTVEQAADYLQVNVKTVYNLCRQDAIRHAHFGRVIRIPRQALEEYVNGHSHQRNTTKIELNLLNIKPNRNAKGGENRKCS